MARLKPTIKVQLADKQAELTSAAEEAREESEFHAREAQRLNASANVTDKQRAAVEEAFAILDAAGVDF